MLASGDCDLALYHTISYHMLDLLCVSKFSTVSLSGHFFERGFVLELESVGRKELGCEISEVMTATWSMVINEIAKSLEARLITNTC